MCAREDERYAEREKREMICGQDEREKRDGRWGPWTDIDGVVFYLSRPLRVSRRMGWVGLIGSRSWEGAAVAAGRQRGRAEAKQEVLRYLGWRYVPGRYVPRHGLPHGRRALPPAMPTGGL